MVGFSTRRTGQAARTPAFVLRSAGRYSGGADSGCDRGRVRRHASCGEISRPVGDHNARWSRRGVEVELAADVVATHPEQDLGRQVAVAARLALAAYQREQKAAIDEALERARAANAVAQSVIGML